MTTEPLNLPSDRTAAGRTFGAEEIELLQQVIRSGQLNSTGATMVPRFEKEFAQLHGLAQAIATTSGSSAIQAALAALDLEPGDEVITTSVTDFGALAPILWHGAIPAFCDLDPESLNPTAATIAARITPRTKAIIVTHLFGLPCEMGPIMAKAGQIPVIEDCAQAPLATWEGKTVGTFGVLAAFSFQQGKHITCGEGGVCISNDEKLARQARVFINKAWPYGEANPDHAFLALNYRMTDLQGAVLCGQLPKLQSIVKSRQDNAALLTEKIQGIPGILPPPCPAEAVHTYWRYSLRVDKDLIPGGPVALGALLKENGVFAAPRYVGKPAFHLGVFKNRRTLGTSQWPYEGTRPGAPVPLERDEDFPGTFKGLDQVLVLPWNERYTSDQVIALAGLLRTGVEKLRKS